MRNNTFRVIYIIEAFDPEGATPDDILVARRFAANKRTAEKIAKRYEKLDLETVIRKATKREWGFINPADVER